jgi:phosphatidylethanolamine/phosphatidyl-N-methylethanolamine N-methyltransferase
LRAKAFNDRSRNPEFSLQFSQAMSALRFFLAWLADPRRVGAMVPSSTALADAMTADVSPASAPVIELGPGTGVFTRSILARGIPEERMALIEYSADFADKLRRDFPRAQVHRMDATHLRHVELFGGERAGAVISGIPLLLMRSKSVIGVLESAFDRLRDDGAFYQFTYVLDTPVAESILDHLGLEATRIGGTLVNFPPAAVYRIRRRTARIIPMRWTGDRAIATPVKAPLYATRADHEPGSRNPRSTI